MKIITREEAIKTISELTEFKGCNKYLSEQTNTQLATQYCLITSNPMDILYGKHDTQVKVITPKYQHLDKRRE